MLSMCACTFFEREKSVNIGPGMARDDSLLGIAANRARVGLIKETLLDEVSDKQVMWPTNSTEPHTILN